MVEYPSRIRPGALEVVAPWMVCAATALAIALVLSLKLDARFLYVGALGAAGTALAVLKAPSLPLLFVAVLAGGHLFRSPWTLVLAGVEWHPRELLLGLLLIHLLAQIVLWKAKLPLDSIHVAVLLYAGAFLVATLSGLLNGHSVRQILEELRYPIFLSAYPCLLVAFSKRSVLGAAIAVMFALAAVGAMAGILLFLRAWETGQTYTLNNAWGEFVQRRFAGQIWQSARTAPQMWMELSIPVLLSLSFSGSLERWKWGMLLPLLALIVLAQAITFMRTAYISLGLSIALVLLFQFRPRLQVLAALALACLGLGLMAIALAWIGPPSLRPQEWDVSLRARMVETSGALEVFAAHPIAGAGLGSGFEGVGFVSQTSQDTYGPSFYQALHNYWLQLLMKSGLLGMCLAAGGIALLLLRIWQIAWRASDEIDRRLLQGLLAGMLAQCVASGTMARLNYASGHVLLAFVAAAAVSIAARAPRAAVPEA